MRREGITDEIMQHIIDDLLRGYEAYKRSHPDVAKILEEQMEGKSEEEFEAQFKETRTHCEGCGEWLQGFDICDQCGRINK
jgi:hypothetical protein